MFKVVFTIIFHGRSRLKAKTIRVTLVKYGQNSAVWQMPPCPLHDFSSVATPMQLLRALISFFRFLYSTCFLLWHSFCFPPLLLLLLSNIFISFSKFSVSSVSRIIPGFVLKVRGADIQKVL